MDESIKNHKAIGPEVKSNIVLGIPNTKNRERQRKLTSDLSVWYKDEDLYSKVAEIIEDANENYVSYRPTEELRKDRLNHILENFVALRREQQLAFITSRIKWIHATGNNEKGRSLYDLPGITPNSRYDNIADDRIIYALSIQSSIRDALLKEFDYKESIVNYFATNKSSTNRGSIEGQEDIFINLGANSFVKRLHEQFALTTEFEAYLAFEEYLILAQRLFESKTSSIQEENSVSKEVIESIFFDIDRLLPEVRNSFYYYLTKDESHENNYSALLTLSRLADKTDFSIISDVDDPSVLRQLCSIIDEDNYDNLNDSLNIIAKQISELRSQTVISLLNIQSHPYPIRYLLRKDVLDIIKKLEANLISVQTKDLLDILGDPISYVFYHLLEEGYLGDLPANTADLIENFIEITDKKEQDQLLHRMAIDLYQNQGPYALDSFSFLVLQASSWNKIAGLIVASLFFCPLIFLMLLLGILISRRLVVRDKMQELLAKESKQYGKEHYEIGLTGNLLGRGNLILELKSLAGRGWSSIAVVGRRGVGKTRALYELLEQHRGVDKPSTINRMDFMS